MASAHSSSLIDFSPISGDRLRRSRKMAAHEVASHRHAPQPPAECSLVPVLPVCDRGQTLDRRMYRWPRPSHSHIPVA